MTRRILIKSILVLGVMLLPTAAFAKGDTRLLGTWTLTSMSQGGKQMPLPPGFQMSVKFTPGAYHFTMTMNNNTQKQVGSWSTKGTSITIQEKGKQKQETMTYTLKGKTLTVSQKGMMMSFTRAAAKK